MNKRRAAREPYEGYTLPAVSERGGQFIDFKSIMESDGPEHKERKPIRIVKKRRMNGN
tara:strand:+ start:96 stop:269 length:174 start_codon:yes stop_codon:yes gene_type:complete